MGAEQQPEVVEIPLEPAPVNPAIIGVLFVRFMVVGITRFARADRNR